MRPSSDSLNMKTTLSAIAAVLTLLQTAWSGYDGGRIVKTIAGSWEESGFADGAGNNARFGFIGGIVSAPNGDVIVTDTTNHRIRKVTSAGIVTTFAGSTRGFKEGIGTAAQLSFPERIALDKAGNLYVSETTGFNSGNLTFRIRKISSKGETSTLRTGSGLIHSMAVYSTTSATRLAFTLEDSTVGMPQIWTISTTGGTPTLLKREGQNVEAIGLSSSSTGTLSATNGTEILNFLPSGSGTSGSWSSISLDSQIWATPLVTTASGDYLYASSLDNQRAIFSLPKPQGETSAEASSILEASEEGTFADFDTPLPTRQGDSKTTVTKGKIDSIAITPSNIVYFTQNTSSEELDYEGGYVWRSESFWDVIADGTIDDIDETWLTPQNSALRQIVPVSFTVEYQDFAHFQPGDTADALSVTVTADGTPKYQWYRSGTKIVGATSKTYTPSASGKIVPGVYNLEIIHGTGTDTASILTPPSVVSVSDSATLVARNLLQDITESNWSAVLGQVIAETKAITASSNDAAFLNGAAAAALAMKDLEASGLLGKLGFTGSPNPLNWSLRHSGTIPEGVLSAESRAFLVLQVYPRLLEADTRLGQIIDKSFITTFPSSNLSSAEGMYVDYADIQLMKGLLQGGMWAIKWMESINTDFAVDDLKTAFSQGRLSIEWILSKYPLLLNPGTATAVTASLGHLKSALDDYFVWSDAVKGGSATVPGRMVSLNGETSVRFLSSLDAEDAVAESTLRSRLNDTRAALDSKANQSIPLAFDSSEEEPLFGLLGAQPGEPYDLKVNPFALFSRTTGWRAEVASLAFTKNLAKSETLTNPANQANKTLKSILPDLSDGDFEKIEQELILVEGSLNDKLHTRWDTEPPTITMTSIGSAGKVTLSSDGTVSVSGTVRDASEVTTVLVKRTDSNGREEVVNGILKAQPPSIIDRSKVYTWQAWIPLSAGSNTITASAVDIWGQTTTQPASQKVQAEIQYAFSVDQEGEGTITSSVSGLTVTGGTLVKLQVNPAKNWVFRHFEIYVNGEELDRVTSPSLTLTVTGETRIVPVFEPDPFRFMTGPVTFAKRVFVTDEISIPLSILTVTVNKTGTLSGRLRIGRQVYPFTSKMNSDNMAQLSFRPQLPLASGSPSPVKPLNLNILLALTPETDKTVLAYSTEIGSTVSNLENLGILKSVTIESNLVFNGIRGSGSAPGFVHLRLTPIGTTSCMGALENGERYTASAPVFYQDAGDANPDAQPIGTTLQPVTSNKYSVMSTAVQFNPPSSESSPEESTLWSATTQYVGERWASNNRWRVDSTGEILSDSESTDGTDWRYLNISQSGAIPQFLPASDQQFGAFNTASNSAQLTATPFSAEGSSDTSYRVGYLKWISATVTVDSTTMTNLRSTYPEMITSGTRKMTFSVNRSTGIFTATAGWRQYTNPSNNSGPMTTILPKSFSGVLVAPDSNAPESRWGIGKSSDGTTLSIEAVSE